MGKKNQNKNSPTAKAPANKTPAKKTAAKKAPELRCFLIPVANSYLLLPNTTVAEVLEFEKPAALDKTPDWVLGHIVWEGWQVPVVDYAELIDMDGNKPKASDRIIIVKSLMEGQRIPYIGIRASGLPTLTTLNEAGIKEQPVKNRVLGLHSQVSVGKKTAIIPDLDRLGQLIAHAAYGALPLTRA